MSSLVAYSSSESENEDDLQYAEKKGRLPLPNQILNMQTKSIHEQPEDDPSQHGGRIRSFQHERGNWATFVYIDVNIKVLDDLKHELIDFLKSKVKLKQCENVHISLTRTIILLHHWIDSFTTSIRSELSNINRFNLQLQEIKIYCNEERTRTFISICINRTMSNFLEEITKRFDKILLEYHLPEFYKEPSFHCSILWCNGDYENELNDNVSALNTILDTYKDNYSEDFLIDVNTIYCKTGNKLFQFDLS